jgi:hypothetical protein
MFDENNRRPAHARGKSAEFAMREYVSESWENYVISMM